MYLRRFFTMKNKFFGGMLVIVATIFVACSTSIPVTVNHPPSMDTNGIERMTVRPFSGSGDRQQIAEELTRIFREKINGLKTGGQQTFQMVDYGSYQKGAVDAVFTGEVSSYEVQDSSYQQTGTNKDGSKYEYTVYERKVSLGFTYRLIRERDGAVIGEKNISCTAQDSNRDRGSLKSGVSLIIPAAQNALGWGSSGPSLFGTQKARFDFTHELIPWTSTEKLVLDKETSRDKAIKDRMKEAEKLVKDGAYKQAQAAYAKIYEETGSLAAGYNQAILTQPLEGLEAAISLLSSLVDATGYSKASVELDRLRGFVGENAAASSNTAGTSQQKIAIETASKALIAVLPADSRVSLLNISKSEKELVDVVIREITDALVAMKDTKKITVLERTNLDVIKAEQQYQASGDVSDDSYVSMGQMLGVETIVTFSITGSQNQRKLTVKSLSVETGEITYSDSLEI
jgi:hypothetical protein